MTDYYEAAKKRGQMLAREKNGNRKKRERGEGRETAWERGRVREGEGE